MAWARVFCASPVRLGKRKGADFGGCASGLPGLAEWGQRLPGRGWRSGKSRRVVNSTLAGEAMAASAALAEAEWIQQIIFDVCFNRVPAPEWFRKTGPFATMWREGSELHNRRLEHQHVVDAKAVFDSLSKEAAGSALDRRAAIDLAIIRDSLQDSGSQIRWVPHELMIVDSLTKVDVAKSNAAMSHLMRTGRLKLVLEVTEMAQRAHGKSVKGRGPSRSRAASQRRLEEGPQTFLCGRDTASWASVCVSFKRCRIDESGGSL